MGTLFSKKSHKRAQQPEITEQDRAILVDIDPSLFVKYSSCLLFVFVQQLKQQRDRLNQNRRRIDNQLERERDIAKNLLKNGQKEYENIVDRLSMCHLFCHIVVHCSFYVRRKCSKYN
jgi:charged multivesicular body protein 6